MYWWSLWGITVTLEKIKDGYQDGCSFKSQIEISFDLSYVLKTDFKLGFHKKGKNSTVQNKEHACECAAHLLKKQSILLFHMLK